MAEIRAEHLSFSYDGVREVLTDLNFIIEQEEAVGLIGANGAGKSTLLKILVGLVSGYRGRVEVGGLYVEKRNLQQIRRQTGYVFQDSESQLFLSTVYEDVAFGPRNYGYDETEVDRLVTAALRQVHMEDMKDRQIYRMSGGQKKLAAMATVLSMEPRMILLDEPSGGLDPRNRRNLIRVIRSMKGARIVASHDLDLVLDTCGRTILIGGGRIVRDGPTDEILTDEKLLYEHGLELPLSLSGRGRYGPERMSRGGIGCS